MEGLDKAAWGQIATFFGVLIATVIATFGGWFKDKIFKKTPPPLSGPAVVMSAAIADSAALNNLGNGINRLVDFLEQEREDAERRDRSLKLCMQEIVDSNDRTAALLRQLIHPFGTQRVADRGERAPPDV